MQTVCLSKALVSKHLQRYVGWLIQMLVGTKMELKHTTNTNVIMITASYHTYHTGLEISVLCTQKDIQL